MFRIPRGYRVYVYGWLLVWTGCGLLILIIMCKRRGRRPRSVEAGEEGPTPTKCCHLCNYTISVNTSRVWDHHRSICAYARRKLLFGLTMISATCPKCCIRNLRVWPRNRGPIMFTCKTCPAGSDTHANDYTNRLSCYPCDYDMCRQCVADRWGPEALGITGGDHCGFGRSAVIERQHRSIVTSLRQTHSTSSRRSRTHVTRLWVELPDYFDVAFEPTAPPAEEEPPPSYEDALQFLMMDGQ